MASNDQVNEDDINIQLKTIVGSIKELKREQQSVRKMLERKLDKLNCELTAKFDEIKVKPDTDLELDLELEQQHTEIEKLLISVQNITDRLKIVEGSITGGEVASEKTAGYLDARETSKNIVPLENIVPRKHRSRLSNRTDATIEVAGHVCNCKSFNTGAFSRVPKSTGGGVTGHLNYDQGSSCGNNFRETYRIDVGNGASNGAPLQPSAQMLDDENQRLEDELSGKVQALKSLSIDIGDEVREHNKFLKQMDDEFDSSGNLLQSSMNRLMAIAKTGGPRFICYLLLFAVFVFFMIWVILKFR